MHKHKCLKEIICTSIYNRILDHGSSGEGVCFRWTFSNTLSAPKMHFPRVLSARDWQIWENSIIVWHFDASCNLPWMNLAVIFARKLMTDSPRIQKNQKYGVKVHNEDNMAHGFFKQLQTLSPSSSYSKNRKNHIEMTI